MHGSFEHIEQDKNRWALSATIAAVSVAITLIILKAGAWTLSGSAGVLGSLADSALDLAGSLLAVAGVRWAAEPADHDHRFGHHKAEAMASLAQIVLISLSAFFVLFESIRRLINPEPLNRADIAIGVMVVSVLLSAGLVLYQSWAMKKSGSLVVEGDRAHYLGDLIANAGTIIALVLAATFGWLRADAVAGILAGLFLLQAVWSIGRRAIPQLMDQEAGERVRAQVMETVLSDPEVRGAHALRTRKAGRRLYIQVHVEMDPAISLRHAHEVSDRVEAALLDRFPGADILLHQDPHGESEPHDAFGRRTDEEAA